jgi:membrane AbrB-like protein
MLRWPVAKERTMKSVFFLLAVAAVGAVLQYAGVPHGLLLGSILGAAIIVSKWRFSPSLRFALGYVQIVLGIATGLMFDAWDSQTIIVLAPSLALMLVCLMVQVAVAGFWLRKVSGWNVKDSLLAVYPGALAAVFDLMESERASGKVMVVHLVRLVTITVLVSVCVPGQPVVDSTVVAPWGSTSLLLVVSLIGLCLLSGRLLLKLGVPAPFMLTAIILTAVYTRLGYLQGLHVPQWSLLLATVLLGALIGCRFREISLPELLRHGRSGLASVSIMLLIAAAFAGLAAWISGHDLMTLWLAYMPGAIETIAIVAFSGGMNVVFVLSHHLTRMVLLHFAPALLVQARRWCEGA